MDWSAVTDFVSSMAVLYNLIVCTVFIAVFYREPWRRSWFGQSVMILAVAIWVFSVQGTLIEIFGAGYRFQEEVRLFGRILVAVAMTQRLLVLSKLRHADRPRV